MPLQEQAQSMRRAVVATNESGGPLCDDERDFFLDSDMSVCSLCGAINSVSLLEYFCIVQYRSRVACWVWLGEVFGY